MPLTTYFTPEQAPNVHNCARMGSVETVIKPLKVHYNTFSK